MPKFRARWGARRCWWQSALPASKSERPSGDPSGLQRSSWPRFSGGLWRRCTTPASWAEPSCTATSAWSCGRWSLETAATSPCCWWTRKVEPGPRPCSSRCMVSAPDSGSLPHLLPQSSGKTSCVLETGEELGSRNLWPLTSWLIQGTAASPQPQVRKLLGFSQVSFWLGQPGFSALQSWSERYLGLFLSQWPWTQYLLPDIDLSHL